MKRLHRLTAILVKLQSKKVVQAAELANKFEVSLRTIYRDMQALTDAGVPIGAEAGTGYYLVDGYSLPPVMFTEKEANALLTASKIIKTNNDQSLINEYQEAIDKVIAVLKTTQKEKLKILEERVFTYNNTVIRTSTSLSVIQQAITDFRVLEIQYTKASGEYSKRLIEPLGVYFTNNTWIMIAHCRLRKDYREFRTDRILNLIETQELFSPKHFSLEDYYKKRAEECDFSTFPKEKYY
ncbi:putative DNA-binding transcriptional regulator YafY [Aquimarina sp. EL_43]|uniref:helix-turn-helix transcriptional regulator n=1 Tax=Aquimarina TaxID=290174 RepID=UPI0004701628|nr:MULTISPECIES: YafY family protein [Aquimarina]MBG6129559.1 putative DNA-binding transcriptional regulator YafY [Aquimarina sp. EL_35]MBG6150624.1 putative DNA-binding transcriptional regulator YafY [Aquimarina sp. EL_32]MBG6168068.1 putative DNA-binding transcriptional regulator YafY [Aquimarina sp. EL_43]